MASRRKRASSVNAVPAAEGVLFSVGTATACAVRTESRDIAVRVEQRGRLAWRLFGFIPLARGVLRFLASLFGFFMGLIASGDLEPQRSTHGRGASRRFARLFRTTPQTLAALGTGLLLPVILFVFLLLLPHLIGQGLTNAGQPRALCNAVACLVRVVGLFASAFLVSRLKLIDRLCMYRGAAAKVTNASIAHGAELTHEQAVLSPRITQRSDGAFLLLTLAAAFIAFACVPPGSVLYSPLGRIVVLLIAAAILGEVVRPLENAKPEGLLYDMGRPYRAIQHLFTIEPHNQMIEVAVCAWQAAVQNDLNGE